MDLRTAFPQTPEHDTITEAAARRMLDELGCAASHPDSPSDSNTSSPLPSMRSAR
jgi:hypothetical protein